MTKIKIIYFLTLMWFTSFLMFPKPEYDPIIDFYRLQSQYSWLTPEVFYIIYNELKRYDNISIDDICALIQYESGNYCRNNSECMRVVHSYAGAIGYMQIMPFHHNGPSKDLYNPSVNIMYGIRYYHWCLKYTNNNKKEALRCYNAGPASNRTLYKGWNNYVFPIIQKSNTSKMAYNKYYKIM